MVSVRLFSSGGYTETGGLENFLRKMHPGLSYERCFPAAAKGPKRSLLRGPRGRDGKVTGEHLVKRMLERLEHDKGSFDVILLVDDADCRFDSMDAYHAWAAETQRKVCRALGADVTFIALLAAPEVESWFVADWENSFRRMYREQFDHLRRALNKKNRDCGHQSIEDFGYPRDNAACALKLSDFIRDALNSAPAPAYYDKRTKGVQMLQTIEPQNVNNKCDRYFRAAYTALQAQAQNN